MRKKIKEKKKKIVVIFFIFVVFLAYAYNLNRQIAEIDDAVIGSVNSGLVIKDTVDNAAVIAKDIVKNYDLRSNTDVAEYLSEKAEDAGYEKKVVNSFSDMVKFRGIFVHKEIYADLKEMFENADGLEMFELKLVSGFRGESKQSDIFYKKLGRVSVREVLSGAVDFKINKILSQSSFPSYSKHHSGYAVDFTCNKGALDDSFRESPCFDWLSENSEKYNFKESYPNDGLDRGPLPEPWEFYWVKG